MRLKRLPHIKPRTNCLVARENQDTACLNFALSWLLYLRQAHNLPSASSLRSLAALAGDGGSEQDELAFLKAKAKESKHWSLVSSTLLEEAKLELRHVSTSPQECKVVIGTDSDFDLQAGVSAKALEHLIQSAHLNVQHASYSLMPAATIFQGSIYDRLGKSSLHIHPCTRSLVSLPFQGTLRRHVLLLPMLIIMFTSGQSHTASRHYSSVDIVLGKECSFGDRVRSQCRLAFSMAQNGSYAAAQESLQSLHSQIKGTLKLEQRVASFARLVALLQAIRKYVLQD